MPWKFEKDPYKIWLSEIILQQTRVEQGLSYYNKFVKKYPTIKKLAAAKETDVFKLWEGLGYYSRCKNLLATAKLIAHDWEGNFPDKYEDILKLKGVGPYTAAAIASFAYNLPHAVVDGNVMRVLARFFGVDTPIDSTEGKKLFAQLSFQLLKKDQAAIYNQAIMDFGATVCKPQLPQCADCILSSKCVALATDTIDTLPIKTKKLIKKNRWFIYIVASYKGNYYLRRRNEKDIWQNLHEFIAIEASKKTTVDELVQLDKFKQIMGTNSTIVHVSEVYKQALTHQTIFAYFIHVQLKKAPPLQGFEAVDIQTVKKLAFPKLIAQYLKDNKGRFK